MLAPGGRIVLIGQDRDTFIIDADDEALTRTIVHARADTVPAPRAARRYRNLLLDAGFREPSVEVHTGVFTSAAMMPMLAGLANGACASGAVSREQAVIRCRQGHDRQGRPGPSRRPLTRAMGADVRSMEGAAG